MSLAELEQATQQLMPSDNPNLTGLGGIKDGRLIQLPFPPRRGPFPIMPFPMPRPGPIMPMPIQPPMLQPVMPDYSSQFEKLGETLGGFGEQLGGFGKQLDALGSFNEQVGGLGKQFEAVNNKLDSLEKGLGSLGNQLASIEQGQPKPQEVQQPQQPSYSPFGFGGLANLFMNMRRF